VQHIEQLIVAELGIGSKKDKISAADDDARVLKYRQATASTKDRTLESKHLANITPWMEGSIILSYLTGKVNARPFSMAEIEYRAKIMLNMMATSFSGSSLCTKHEEVNYMKPLSDKMKEWMPKQWNIYKQKKGIVIAEPE
jgi:hypothetical protein